MRPSTRATARRNGPGTRRLQRRWHGGERKWRGGALGDADAGDRCRRLLPVAARSGRAPRPESLADLLAATRHRRIAKRAQLLRAGDVAEDLFFVHAGLLRYYVSDPAANGAERTGQFLDEGSIVTNAASLLMGSGVGDVGQGSPPVRAQLEAARQDRGPLHLSRPAPFHGLGR